MRRHHYKPYKKKHYTKTEKFMYHTGKVIGGTKTALKKGYEAVTSPKVRHYFKTTRQEIAREVEQPQIIQQETPQKRYPTQEEIDNWNRIRRIVIKKKTERKMRPFKEPFSTVTEEQESNKLQLGYGGF